MGYYFFKWTQNAITNGSIDPERALVALVVFLVAMIVLSYLCDKLSRKSSD